MNVNHDVSRHSLPAIDFEFVIPRNEREALISLNDLLRELLLKNPTAALTQSRYSWRHNLVLLPIAHYLASLIARGMSLFVYINGYTNPATYFSRINPDIVSVDLDEVLIMIQCSSKLVPLSQETTKERRLSNASQQIPNNLH